MASTYRLNSSSDYLTANYFDSKDNTIYIHKHIDRGELAAAEQHWEYVAAIGESQQFEELEVSGVVLRGEKLVELVGDLRPKSTTTSSSSSSSFYSLRVNHEGRCYVRSSSMGDCLHGAKLNAFFDWSKYNVVGTKKNVTTVVESSWKEVAEERKREVEACKLKLNKFIVDHSKEGKEQEEGKELICCDAGEEGRSSKSVGYMKMMDCFAVSVMVFYIVGLYYWGAKLLSLLLPKKTT